MSPIISALLALDGNIVGYVQMRMGRNLMNLKAKTKWKIADGGPIEGSGRLSESQKEYFGFAIRQNTLSEANQTDREVDVYTMKKNVIAILLHSLRIKSQDAAKQHCFCPIHETSLSKWQQDYVTGTSTFKENECLPEVFFEL